MMDCSHHHDEKVTPFGLFVEFLASPQGQKWYKEAMATYKENQNERKENNGRVSEA